jgi:phosphatidylglycerol:prolipoprotein diacylglycerol transferase
MNFWQTLPSRIDPVAFSIGIPVRWYSLMYVVAFAVTYGLVRHRIKKEGWSVAMSKIDDFMFYAMIGVIAGGRMGYVLFYEWQTFVRAPWKIIIPFEQVQGVWEFTGLYGMSFHGGAIGVALMFIWYCRKHQLPMLTWSDLFTPAIPLGYTFGRIGNFINGELYGRPTDVAWAMVFPSDPYQLLRHPSQLYEGFLEGIVLFAVLWSLKRKWNYAGAISCLYLVGYGVIRFFVEFTREPDEHLGFVWGPLSMGQLLSVVMVVTGCLLWIIARRKQQPAVIK